jgi:hypothetical protein
MDESIELGGRLDVDVGRGRILKVTPSIGTKKTIFS